MKREYSIESKTILLPTIIAEGAFWDALEKVEGSGPNPERDARLQSEIVPILVERANRHYKGNRLFRKQITSNEKGRDRLWAFMAHWAEAILKNKELVSVLLSPPHSLPLTTSKP